MKKFETPELKVIELEAMVQLTGTSLPGDGTVCPLDLAEDCIQFD